MLVALFDAIAALPQLLGLVKTFASWIIAQIDQAEKRKLASDLAKATGEAKQTKDTSGMDQIFDPKKKK